MPVSFLTVEDAAAAGASILAMAGAPDVRTFLDTAPYVATRTALKALDTTKDTTAILKEAGREGVFNWKTGDYSARIAADTAEGLYIKANAVSAALGAWVRVFNGRADISWYGAVGDGDTIDDAAINAAFASGVPLTGSGLTYGVNGNISIPANLDLEYATFKQLSHNDPNRKTLYANGVDNVRLVRVKVNRNGDGSGGGLATAAGIFISGGSGHLLEDCEVWGDDKGNGIAVLDATDFDIIRPYVHDIKGGTSAHAEIEDDVVQGIYLRGSRWRLTNPRVEDLTSQWSGHAEWNRFTRGIAVSGSDDFDIESPIVERVDQGIDLTGDMNPKRWAISNGKLSYCLTYGYKAANSPKYGGYVNCVAYRTGIAGFVASAPSSVSTHQTSKIEYIACRAIATGYNPAIVATIAGFRVQNSSAYTDCPRSLRYIGCSADDDGEGNMDYGFHSEVVGPPANGDIWVEAVQCSVVGAVTASYLNFNQGIFIRGLSGTQSIPNSAFTNIIWSTTVANRMNAINSGDHAEIVIRRAGIYMVAGCISFAAAAGGTRIARATRNGTAVPGSYSRNTASSTAIMAFSFVVACDVADVLKIQAFQDSGGALNVTTDTAVTVALISPGQGAT